MKRKTTLKVVDGRDEEKPAKKRGADREDEEKPGRKRGAGARPLWNGTISFGLINIPVRLYMGVRRKGVRFHLLHEKDNARLTRKYVCPVEDKEVPADEIKKGYEISRDQHVIVEEKELEALMPKASRTIELLYFVDVGEVDPVYFETPYYLLPDENAAKAYRLLHNALNSKKKAAIAQFVLRNKEYIALVRSVDTVLCLDTMRYPDEVVFAQDLNWKPPEVKIRDQELKMAGDLIDSLTSRFEPGKLHDDYREAVMDLVKRKAEGEKIVTAPTEEEESPQVIDLMAALQKSLHQAKGHSKLKKTA